MDLGQVVGLFEHPHTADQHDRQIAVLRRVLQPSQVQGLTYKQLPAVCKLLDLVWNRVEAGAGGFESFLCQLIYLCGKPIIRSKANEEFRGGLSLFEEVVCKLEQFIHVSKPNVQKAVAMSLREIALGRDHLRTNKPTTRQVLGAGEVLEDLRPVPQVLNQGAILRAGIVSGLVKELDTQIAAMISGGVGVLSDHSGMIATMSRSPRHVAGEQGHHHDEFDLDDEAAGGAEMRALEVDARTMRAEVVSTLRSDKRDVLTVFMELLKDISASPGNAAEMVKFDAMRAVIDLLSRVVAEPRDPLINTCVEVLWNCLEASQDILETGNPAQSRQELIYRRRKTNAMYALSNPRAIGVLKDLFETLLLCGHRESDKELRNEVLIVASFIAKQKRSHKHFRETGLLDVLLTYATAAESECATDADPHNFATTLAPDIELKRILWSLLSDLSRFDPENLSRIVQSDLIGTLVMYMNVDLRLRADAEAAPEGTAREGTIGAATGLMLADTGGDEEFKAGDMGTIATGQTTATDGHPEEGGGAAYIPRVIERLPRTHLRVLQQQAMAVLLNLAPRASGKFKAYAGHIITLRFLDSCSDNPDSRSLVQGALMLLLSFVGLPGLQDELGELDAVRIMLNRFNDLGAPSSLRADAICITSRLCATHDANQTTFRRAEGIASLVNQIEEYSRARQPAPRPKKGALNPASIGGSGSASEKVSALIVGVMDCLWNAVAGNHKSEARFLTVGGMDSLLSLLEVAPVLMRHQICGLISDLCENHRIVPYVKAWRSDRTMQSSTELLMHVFEDEEIRLQFDRPGGVIHNLWTPLRSHELRDPANPPASGVGASTGSGSSVSSSPAAFARLNKALQKSTTYRTEQNLRRAIESKDLRAKITGILGRLGFAWAADGLAASDRATLLMTQNYVAFRTGEAWSQVRASLRSKNVKPIAADSLLIETKLEDAFNTARVVKCEQMNLSEESAGLESKKEQAFFESILLQRDQMIRQEQIKRSAVAPKKKKVHSSAEGGEEDAPVEATGSIMSASITTTDMESRSIATN